VFSATNHQLENAIPQRTFCRKLNFTLEKAFSPTSLRPENSFSATRLLSEIKFDAGKKRFPLLASDGKHVFRNVPSAGN